MERNVMEKAGAVLAVVLAAGAAACSGDQEPMDGVEQVVRAVQQGELVRHVSDVEYDIKLVLEDSVGRYTITAANENEIKPVIQNVEVIGLEFIRQYGDINGSFYGGFHDGATDAHGEVTEFNFSMGSFPKSISLELIGRSNGRVELRIGPLSIDLTAKAKSTYGSSIWNASVVTRTPSFYVVGDYDINSGYVSNARLENFNLYVDLNVSSGLLNILGFEDLLDFMEANYENKIRNSLASKLNEFSSAQYKLFDIAEALPSNRYLVAAGIDIAQEVKNLLSSSVEGRRLKIFMSRQHTRYSSNPAVSVYSGSDVFFTAHELRIEFGSRYKVRLWDIPHFGLTPATACNWGECFAPVSTADQPNTNQGFYSLDVHTFPPPPPPTIPSGSGCTWSSTPSYGNGMGGSTYYEYPPIGPCQHRLKKVTTTATGSVTVQYAY